MQVKRIGLKAYRNYEELQVATDHQVNIFVGANAQGKTNLLEAVYVMALSKSHRTNRDRELIGWEQESCSIHLEVEKKYGTQQLELTITPHGKKVKVNGLEQRRLSDFIGIVNVVMFAPEDLELVKGAPGIRRRFLDMEISQVYPSYMHALLQYQKVLQQRNNLLKSSFGSRDKAEAMLDVFNDQLAAYGVKIIKKRQDFLKKLQRWAAQIHGGITAGKEELRIVYQPSFDLGGEQDEAVLFDRFMVKLSQVKEQEFRRGVTLVGPHRDDLAFFLNEREAQTYGSQGQQRTTALSLKLAEIELIHEETGEYPVLLLDDVLSELDRQRQTQLIDTFQSKVQTFITTTGVDSVDLHTLEDVHLVHVEQGRIVE